jgi:signal transduction histidine kinase
MGKTTAEKKTSKLANENFTIVLEKRTLEFVGSWDIHDPLERQGGESITANNEKFVELNGCNYRVYNEDVQAFAEIINDVKPGNNIHLRIRVVSPQNEVRELEASGRFETTAAKNDFHPNSADGLPSTMATRLNGNLEAVSNAGLIGTFHWDANKDVFTADETTREYLAIDERSLTANTLSNVLAFIPHADRPVIANAFANALERRGILSVEFHVKENTGDIRYLLIRGAVEKNYSGKAVGIAGIVVDITTTKETNKELQQSQRRQEFLLTLNDSIRSAGGRDDIQLVVCRMLAEHLMVARVYLIEYNHHNKTCSINHDYVRNGEISRAGILPMFDFEHLTTALLAGRTLAVRDTFKSDEIDANTGSYFASTGVRAIIAAPVIRNDKIVAALVVTNSTATQWASADVSLVNETAERTWVALEEKEADDNLRESVKASTEELEKSYEIQRQSEELAGIGNWDYHVQTKEFKWSEGMYKLFNLESGTDVQPQIYVDFAIDEDKPIASRIVDHFQTNLQAFEETLRIKADGKIKTLKVKGTIFHENGRPSRLIGVDFDISALVESRKALEEQHERLLEAQKIGQLGSYEFDIVSNRVRWSDEMYSLMGIPPGTALTFDDAINVYLPEDAAIMQNMAAKSIETGDGFEMEAAFKKADDQSVHYVFVANKVVRDRFGRAIKLRGIAQDVTERKKAAMEILRMQEILAQQAEDKYRQLFNSIDEGFSIIELLFDPAGKPNDFRFIEANPAFERQTGFKNILGLTILEVSAVHHDRWINMFGMVATTMSPARFIEMLGDRWYEVYAFPAGESGSNRAGILFHDITERKRSEQEMKKLYGELKELDRAKTNFFSNITHEFRTPLTLLLGPLEDVIRKSSGDLPNRQRDQLLLAQRNALRLQKLVNTLLDFSRIEAGQMDAVFQPTDICSITRDLAGNFRSAIENAGLKFIVTCDKLPDPVYVNRPMYEKIVLNLLSNAFKFTFEGQIEIKIRQNKNKIELRVTDTGVGISHADQRRIFRQFNRVEGVRSRTYEGTGIGLALVKEMVNIHGGDISVTSEPLRGSEFIVRFPKGKDHLPADRILEVKPKSAGNSLPGYLEEVRSWLNTSQANENIAREDDHAYMKPVVLVVDDNNDMRSYVASILESRYKVIHADNGRNAIKIIEAGLIPDLVLTDVMMPEMNGYELLTALKQGDWPKNIPVILLTAQSTEESRIEGLHYGADDYLVKPFSSRELAARVESRIQIARLKDESERALISANRQLETIVDQRTVELKTKNDMLQHRNLQLNLINEELKGLTFAAGHDMREPLRKLRFFAHRLMTEEDGNLSDKGKEYFNKIMSFIQAMNDLVSDVSRYSFYSDNPAQPTTIDLEVLLRSLQEFLKPVLEENNVTLSVNVAPALSGDYEQVKQLLLNLISNALKFRKPGHQLNIVVAGKIISGKFIEHDVVDKSKSYYELEVRDNGIGFEQQYEKQIFQIFRKLHGRALSPGTGVGLTIVRKIVENHKGFVEAKSTLGLGSSFKCYFPID